MVTVSYGVVKSKGCGSKGKKRGLVSYGPRSSITTPALEVDSVVPHEASLAALEAHLADTAFKNGLTPVHVVVVVLYHHFRRPAEEED